MVRLLKEPEPLQLYQWLEAQSHCAFALGCLLHWEGKALPIDLDNIPNLEEGTDLLTYIDSLLEAPWEDSSATRGEIAERANAIYSPTEYFWFVVLCQTFQTQYPGWRPLGREESAPSEGEAPPATPSE